MSIFGRFLEALEVTELHVSTEGPLELFEAHYTIAHLTTTFLFKSS